jgi:cell division protein FtsW
VAAETLINIGAVVGVLPVTGIPLPFISFGGSSLVITMAGAGLLINVARQGESVRSRTVRARIGIGGASLRGAGVRKGR